MSVRVCFIAQARKAAGCDDVVAPWRDGLTLSALFAELAVARGEDFRRFAFRDDGRLQPTLILTINDQPVTRSRVAEAVLNDGDVVTMIPPVAGG